MKTRLTSSELMEDIEYSTVLLFYKVVPSDKARSGHPGTPGPSSTDTKYNPRQAYIDGIIETLKQLRPYV
jgi:hypothetical protein